MAKWQELPSVLWELIYDKLDLLECLRFGAVCPLFRSVMLDRHRIFPPLLMLPPAMETSKTREFLSLSGTYRINLPELHGKWCCGSSFGWLFTVDYNSGDINMLNPISRAKIQLPPLSTFSDPHGGSEQDPERNYEFIERATVSKSPSLSNDFVVIAIFTRLRVFAFCRPGDKTWTTLPCHGDHCEEVIYHKGKFYAITNWGALKCWDSCGLDAQVETIIPAPKDEEALHRYLVECPSGELLKVCRYTEYVDNEDDDDESEGHFHTLRFEVYKLDEKERKWIPMKSLGDKALFLGYNRPICVSVLEHPELEADCIYFTDDYFEGYNENPDGCVDNGVYSLKDGKINELFKNPPFWTSPCIWVSPSIC